MIRLAKELSLPLDAVTQTMAAIARKGAGKTYLAQLMAEQMVDAEAQVVALDPVGNWWSLRVAADGKGKGKDVFVLGGERGDVPLTPEAGARVARFLIERRVSAVLDVSPFREGERKRFAADFAEEFFHRKKAQRSAVHLFIEEAQKFIPQRSGPDEARMLGAFENIVRLGRNYGIGATLITQRPQSVNKEVLSQVECLCVLQVNGTHERKALEEWVQEAGADRKLVGELPGLERGEGFVWSPSWLRIFDRVHFAKKTTFDASATPEVGKAARAATLAAVDVEQLRADLAEVVKQAEADDPKALKRRIAELERAGRSHEGFRPAPAPIQIEVPVLNAADVAAIEAAADKVVAAANEFRRIAETAVSISGGCFDQAKGILEAARRVAGRAPVAATPASGRPPRAPTPRVTRTAEPRRGPATGDLTGPEQRIIDAIAWLESLGVETPEQTAVAFLAGYTIGGGAFNNPRGRLHQRGFIKYVGNGLRLTEEGTAHANLPETPLTTEQLQRAVLDRLPGPEQRILKPLLESYPAPMGMEDLARAAGYEPGGGAFNNPRGRLRSLGLIDYPERGQVVARDILFLERV
jgi:hypothetical protein